MSALTLDTALVKTGLVDEQAARLGGIQLGHNSQFSHIVIGLEADLSGADIGLARFPAHNIFGTVRGGSV